MKHFLGIETPPLLEGSLWAASKLKSELPKDLQIEHMPLKELSSLAEDIHIKTNLDIREFLGIGKASQSIQGEFVNNTSKLTEIDNYRKRHQKVGGTKL